jgi:hypothetical protein
VLTCRKGFASSSYGGVYAAEVLQTLEILFHEAQPHTEIETKDNRLTLALEDIDPEARGVLGRFAVLVIQASSQLSKDR